MRVDLNNPRIEMYDEQMRGYLFPETHILGCTHPHYMLNGSIVEIAHNWRCNHLLRRYHLNNATMRQHPM